MIRLIQRRLIVPRGDTGTFSIPVLVGKKLGDLPIFTVFDPLTHRKIFEKVMQLSNGVLNLELTHGDTVNLPVGQYVWDIKFYTDPVFMDGVLVSGSEVDSYYSAFALPECEIRETGDNLLMGDDAPATKLAPEEINYVEAAVAEIRANKDAVVAGAAEAAISASSAENYASAAAASAQAAEDIKDSVLAAEQSASVAAQAAAASAEQAAATAQSIQAEIPTQVSQLENDAGYLTQHQDISGKADSADLAAVATSGSYNDLLNKPTIPTAVSQLTDDSGHYTKPVGGIPASDLANGVLDVWSGLTYHTSTMSTDSDSFVLGGATDAPTEINKCLVTSTPDANVIPKFDYQGRLHSVTPEEEWDGSNAVATTEYVDTMISNNMPEVPTNVSELNNDAGYLTSYTETDPTVPSWAKAAQKPSYTAAEVGAPTTQEMNTAIANAIGNVHQFGVQVVQELPTQDIQEHTVYFVPKTGETNDVYDEYIYVNNAWEMIGNTQIDLSNYVQKTDYATTSNAGIVKIGSGLYVGSNGNITTYQASSADIKAGTNSYNPITAKKTGETVFYGLAKAAGDTTQSQSANSVGTYTNEAKTAIQNMLDVPNKAEVEQKAPVIYKTGTSPIINAIPNTPLKSLTLTIAGDPTDVGTSSASITVGPSTTTAEGTIYTKSFDPIYEGTLDFISGKLTITKAILDLGSIGYNFNTDYNYFYSQALYGIIDTNDPIYSSDMTVHTVEEIQSGEEGVAFGGATYIYVYNDNYVGMTIDEFKAAVAGKYIAYTLRNPRVIELGATEIRTLNGTTYIMSDDGTVSIEYQVDTKSYVDSNIVVQDIQINEMSILNNGIANIPMASSTNAGVIKVKNTDVNAAITNGGSVLINEVLYVVGTSNEYSLKSGADQAALLSAAYQHKSVFYGLAKAAGISGSHAGNTVGIYTDAAKQAIQNMLGITALLSMEEAATATAAHAENSLFLMGGKLHKVTSAIAVGDAVEVGTNCQVVKADEVFIKNTDQATTTNLGIVKINTGYGINIESGTGALYIVPPTDNEIKGAAGRFKPIVPEQLHKAVFYGLAKAAGDSTQSISTNAVGTYTTEAKEAIQTMLGITDALATKLDAAEAGLKVVRLI